MLNNSSNGEMGFSQINVKAATITGGVVGFLCWLFGLGIGFNSMPIYGFMSSMMSYYMMGYSNFAILYLITLIVVGAILGGIIAIVYNWSLTLK